MKTVNYRYLLGGVVLVGILVGTVWILKATRAKIPSFAESFPRSKGPVDAPVQIIEYSDFQCPSCRLAQVSLSSLLLEKEEKFRLIFQHFPLQGHAWSPLAHQAAECAAEQKQFWAYHDRLYSDQDAWAEDREPARRMFQYARDLGLDLERFSGCLENLEVTERIKIELMEGKVQGVSSTPSFFIQSKMAVGEKQLREAVDGWVRDRAKIADF